MSRKTLVWIVTYMFFGGFSALRAAEDTPPMGCGWGHGTTGSAPAEHDGGGDGIVDQCHGKPGNDGTCTFSDGSWNVSVTCEVDYPPSGAVLKTCSGTVNCGTLRGTWGGRDYNIWVGFDEDDGDLYMASQSPNGTIVIADCNR